MHVFKVLAVVKYQLKAAMVITDVQKQSKSYINTCSAFLNSS